MCLPETMETEILKHTKVKEDLLMKYFVELDNAIKTRWAVNDNFFCKSPFGYAKQISLGYKLLICTTHVF